MIDNFAEELFDIYVSSFPEEERRPFKTPHELIGFIVEHPGMEVRVDEEDGHIRGFISFWRINDFVYVEHLAVAPQQRGKGVGRDMMLRMLRSTRRPCVLEVEPPVDSLTRRRIRFYESLGLTPRPKINYTQPPYASGGKSVPLLIMASPSLSDEKLCEEVIPAIKLVVYDATRKR